MKKVLLISLAFAATLQTARATNVAVFDFFGLLSSPVTYSSGAAVPNGQGLVRIGYFNTSSQTPFWLYDLVSLTNPNKVNAALESFIPLGENATAPNLGDVPAAGTGPRFTQRVILGVTQPGRLAGAINGVIPAPGTPNSASAAGVPAGSRLFLLIYSGSNPRFEYGSEFGVFSADNWLMPSDSTVDLVLRTTDIDTAAEVFVGTFGPSGSLKLSWSPEPGTGTLALFSGLLWTCRRLRPAP